MATITNVDDVPITELELSVRSMNTLQKLGVETVGQMRKVTRKDIQGVKGAGQKTLNEIREIISYIENPPDTEVEHALEAINLLNLMEKHRPDLEVLRSGPERKLHLYRRLG